MKIKIIPIILSLLVMVSCNKGKAWLFPGPEGMESSKNYSVYINKQPAFVYDAPVYYELNNPNRVSSFVQFDMQGKIEIEIEPNKKIETVRIRPSNLEVPFKIINNKIILSLNEPIKLSIEINEGIDDNLMIFANPPEIDIPEKYDKDVIYFAPGIHYIDDEYGFLELKSNQTLYLAGGAVLHARIIAKNVQNIKITGRGIIDGSTLLGRHPDYYRKYLGEPDTIRRPNFVRFTNCDNITVEGIVLNDSPAWMLVFNSCNDVKVDNLKGFGYVDNSDGIDIVGGKNITINDVFLRNNDDCIVLKGMPDDIDNVLVANSIIWTDRANGLQIGHETLMNTISNVTFRNIDILEQRNRYIGHSALSIFNGDSALISDITYDNIRVENCERLIGLIIEKGFYNRASKRGKIENIHFKNIHSNKSLDIHMDGFNEEFAIKNISFENLHLNGELASPEFFLNPYVYNITLKQNNSDSLFIPSSIAKGTTYKTIDIVPWCNRSLYDEIPGDGKGWFDLGPSEDMAELKGTLQQITEIPFQISDDLEKGAIVLRSSQYLTEQPYASYPIKISQKAKYLFFLQATAFTNGFVDIVPTEAWIGGAGKLLFNQSPTGTSLWYYTVRYKGGGSKVKIPVKAGMNIEDWGVWAPGGWVAQLNGKKFYVQQWENPYPDKIIESIKMHSALKPEVPALLALTIGN